jgi:hypothetical protein
VPHCNEDNQGITPKNQGKRRHTRVTGSILIQKHDVAIYIAYRSAYVANRANACNESDNEESTPARCTRYLRQAGIEVIRKFESFRLGIILPLGS